MADRMGVKAAIQLIKAAASDGRLSEEVAATLSDFVDAHQEINKDDPNYDRHCSACGCKIHRTNAAGMCASCYVRHIVRIENQ